MNISAAFLPLSKARRDHAENVQMKQNQLNYTRGRGFESIKKKRKKRVENELKILFGGSAEVVGRRSAGDTPTKASRSPVLPFLRRSISRPQLGSRSKSSFLSLSLGVFHASDNIRLRELRVPLSFSPPVSFDLLVAMGENRI